MPRTAGRTHLTPKDVEDIAVSIANLSFRVRPTWQHVQSAALSVTRRSYSRQALSAHPTIVHAYDAKVVEYRRFRSSGAEPQLVEHDIPPEGRRIERLEAEKAELERKVVALDQRLMLHIINAVRLGIPTRELERPSEKPHKRATDSTTGRKTSLRPVR